VNYKPNAPFSLIFVTFFLCKPTWAGSLLVSLPTFPVTFSHFLATPSPSPSPLFTHPTSHPQPLRVFSRNNQPTKASASFEVSIMLDFFMVPFLLVLLSTQSSLVYPVSFHRVLCVFWVEILGFRSTFLGQFSHDTRLTSGFTGVLRVH
jgi:hypothetical protein